MAMCELAQLRDNAHMRRIGQVLLSGAVLGVLGTLAFGLAHAVLIAPIWWSLPGGVAFALLAGIGMAWSFAELHGRAGMPRVADGWKFGALVWVALAPMTVFANAVRAAGFHDPARDTWEVMAGLALSFAAGAAVGWSRARRWRAAVLMGVTLVAVAMVMGGPIPVVNGVWAAGLFAAFLPIYAAAGALLAALERAYGCKAARATAGA